MNSALYNDLIAKSKTKSFYVFKPSVFRTEWKSLLGAYRKQYINTNIAYSFKTNYVPALLNEVKSLGGYAEVVSYMELELAMLVGFKANEIFFNGPFKSVQAIEFCIDRDILINIDSYEEFARIKKVAYKKKAIVRVGLRVNYPSSKYKSRFGIEAYSKEMSNILRILEEAEFIHLVSIHCHLAPRDLKKWKFVSDSVLEFLKTLRPIHLKRIKYISLGGGLYSNMSNKMRDQIGVNSVSFDEYAETTAILCGYFNENFNGKVELIIEPGTALASVCFDYVVEIQSIKRMDNLSIVNVSGSVYNLNPSANRLNFDHEIVRSKSIPRQRVKVTEAIVTGYTCIESDILLRDFTGEICEGDLIVFKEIGSYSVVMKPPFILPACPIYRYDPSYGLDEIRNEESTSDIFKLYKLK